MFGMKYFDPSMKGWITVQTFMVLQTISLVIAAAFALVYLNDSSASATAIIAGFVPFFIFRLLRENLSVRLLGGSPTGEHLARVAANDSKAKTHKERWVLVSGIVILLMFFAAFFLDFFLQTSYAKAAGPILLVPTAFIYYYIWAEVIRHRYRLALEKKGYIELMVNQKAERA